MNKSNNYLIRSVWSPAVPGSENGERGRQLSGGTRETEWGGGKIFQEFYKNISDQKIIFGGTSAGGRGSMVLVDFLHDLVHDSTIIYGLHDSGAYQGEVSIKVYGSPDTIQTLSPTTTTTPSALSAWTPSISTNLPSGRGSKISPL